MPLTRTTGGGVVPAGSISAAEVAADVATQAELDTVNTAITTADTVVKTALLGAYRTIATFGGRVSTSAVTATNYFFNSSGNDIVAGNPGTVAGAAYSYAAYLAAADYAVTGYTAQLRLRVITGSPSAAPAITLTTTLNPLTITTSTQTVGTAVVDSTVTHTTPAASTYTPAVSIAFTFPADGFYAPIMTLSGTPAGGIGIHAQLQLRHIPT